MIAYQTLVRAAFVLLSIVHLASGLAWGAALQTEGVQATEETIYISMVVYVSSMVVVALATWTVARYDMRRIQRMDELEALVRSFTDGQEQSKPAGGAG